MCMIFVKNNKKSERTRAKHPAASFSQTQKPLHDAAQHCQGLGSTICDYSHYSIGHVALFAVTVPLFAAICG